ncbi:hypothetical protein AAFF_G00323400 [Aldrovandia affinis]|uniref:NAD(P)(+)--arginine ADP-ribosyltransferase n=1 Tax=Aldrovandia affinis TaxID=143900 RepID=A0AAD7R7C5_9TELE|nr:hypothetical protein AAFF_G00323400 [Aldrovandia affinis]
MEKSPEVQDFLSVGPTDPHSTEGESDTSEAMGVQRGRVITLFLIGAIIHTVESAVRQMDMSNSSVDDQFLGCQEKMLQKVLGKGGLLEKEQMNNNMFLEAWNSTLCDKDIPGGRKEHTVALVTYTHGRKVFRQSFNAASLSQGGNVSNYHNFPYKALHFLLTDALRLLRPKGCDTAYHQSQHQYEVGVGAEVRFGHFTSAVSGEDLDEGATPDGGTLFNITSCAAANVEDHACNPEDFQLLIPPFEVFRVEDVQDVQGPDAYRVIRLKHTKFHSSHDCYVFSSSPRAPDSSADSVNSSMLLLLAASLCLCAYYLGQTLL